jgi:pentatricopeptide repeat protein
MIAASVKPNSATYPEIVGAWARAGQFTRVEAVIARIESEGGIESLGEKVYHAFISGCCDADRPEDAERVLKRWNLEKYDLERIADRKGVISRPVAASYGMVIDHYASEGRMVEARRLLSQMQWDSVAPSIEIFNMLLKGYLLLDNLGAAQDVFRELEGSGTLNPKP